MPLAHSVQRAASRLAQKRVILLDDPTHPPAPEALWQRTWFAIYVWPAWEWRVRQELVAAGFDVFLPVATYWNASRFRVRRQLERSLLTRYLFVGVRGRRFTDDDGARIRGTEGVVAVLGDFGRPVEVPRVNLIELAGEIASGRFNETKDVLATGDVVSITGGPFAGFAAAVDQDVPKETSPDATIRLMMKIMGRETVMHIALADLERAPAGPA